MRFPPSVDLHLVHLPGREGRIAEPVATSLSELVRPLAVGLLPHLSGPVAFYGHSFGALLAFAVARELRHRAWPTPEHLVLTSSRAPHLPLRTPPLCKMDDVELTRTLVEIGGLPASHAHDRALLELVLPIVRADSLLDEFFEYTEEPPLCARMTVLSGSDDDSVEAWELDAWQQHTTGSFERRMLPGGHFFLHDLEAGAAVELLAGLVQPRR